MSFFLRFLAIIFEILFSVFVNLTEIGIMHSMDIVRGSFDFIVVAEVTTFEDFAAIKLVVESSGAVKNLTMLEAIDFTKSTTMASKIAYKAPGQ